MAHSKSEIIKPFAEGPVPLPVFFQDSVRRLIHDNLDFANASSAGSRSVESVAFIDEFPIRGEPIRYHYAYELTDSRRGLNVLGLVLDRPRLMLHTQFTSPTHESFRPWAQRVNSHRHYFDTCQGLGIVAHHYQVPPNQVHEPLEGQVEDPKRIDDPLDDIKIKTLKADIDALRRAQPIKPLTNLFRVPLDI